MFKKGDLFFLNVRGKILFQHLEAENGIIMSDSYVLLKYDFHAPPEEVEYHGYDVLIKGRLFTEIPEKFLVRIIKHEENLK